MEHSDKRRFEAAQADAGMRLDAFLAQQCPEMTRSRLGKLIEEGCVSVDGRAAEKPGAKIKSGQCVELFVPQVKEATVEAQDIPLEILYEDADVAVVNKPCGMVVHPAAGNEDGTLVNALLFHIKDLSGIGGEMRPGIVHRLDKDTSGVLMIAKNDMAHQSLSEQLKERTMEKHYLAVAQGGFAQDEGEVDAPIGRHPVDRKRMAIVPDGRPSRTEFKVKERLRGCTLLDVHLLTGRTHQIRVHMASLGHPLLGDVIYGSKRPPHNAPRLMLHAWWVAFTHPRTGEIVRVEAPMPAAFAAAVEKWKER